MAQRDKDEANTEILTIPLCIDSNIRPPPPPPPSSSGPKKPRSNPVRSGEAAEAEERTAVVAAVKRCLRCGKRVGLLGFRCRCGDLFCGDHRYSDRHECGFDYKRLGKESIERENPVIRAAKIVKI